MSPSFSQNVLPQTPLGVEISSYAPFSPAFDARVQTLLDDWHTPGLAVAVIHGNETWMKVCTVLGLLQNLAQATIFRSHSEPFSSTVHVRVLSSHRKISQTASHFRWVSLQRLDV